MQVSDFLEKVDRYGDLPLLFELSSGHVVQGGYHVTEIKNASYETIDCGNSLHTWHEVVVQLWVPSEASVDDGWMPTGKFRKIWDAVDGRLALHRNAEIRFEYGDSQHLTSNYQVQGLVETEDGLVVQLAPPRTMCKPREILVPFNVVGDAVQAAVQKARDMVPARLETVIPLALVNAGGGGGESCCAPAPSSEVSCCG